MQVEAESSERSAAVSLIPAPEPSAILLYLIGSIPTSRSYDMLNTAVQ